MAGHVLVPWLVFATLLFLGAKHFASGVTAYAFKLLGLGAYVCAIWLVVRY